VQTEDCRRPIPETLDSSRTIPFLVWRRMEVKPGYRKISYSTEEASAAQFNAKFKAQLPVFIKHKSMVKNQYDQVLELKSNLKRQSCTIQVDYSENYTCSEYEEVQSDYINKSFVTLHPML
ncbi:hypothetical protein LSAT2_015071, partial [Lamellibrachia satsuma]